MAWKSVLVAALAAACGSSDDGGSGGSSGASGTGNASGSAGSAAAGTSADGGGGTGAGGGSGGAPSCAALSSACSDCHIPNCETEHQACAASTECSTAHAQAGACICGAQANGDSAGVDACVATEQSANAEAKALIDCMVSECGVACAL